MDNTAFLLILQDTYFEYLKSGARSNKKLKVLHGAIASDFAQTLGSKYVVKSLGYKQGKEHNINGRYINKVVDITILNGEKVLAGIGVKFVMSNYAQNSNNYFENMLGETANIRCEDIAYFQILIIPRVLPYFKNSGNIKKWETVTKHNLKKYITLSKDNVSTYFHTPIKTLLYTIELQTIETNYAMSRNDYIRILSNSKNNSLNLSTVDIVPISCFDRTVIYNNYEIFREKVINYIKSL